MGLFAEEVNGARGRSAARDGGMGGGGGQWEGTGASWLTGDVLEGPARLNSSREGGRKSKTASRAAWSGDGIPRATTEARFHSTSLAARPQVCVNDPHGAGDKDSCEWAKDMRARKDQTQANTSTPTHQQAGRDPLLRTCKQWKSIKAHARPPARLPTPAHSHPLLHTRSLKHTLAARSSR